MATETLRSSFTPDGQRVFLEFDPKRQKFRIGTRWAWLASFDSIWDACDAFEVVELAEGDLRKLARIAKAEIKRTSRHNFLQTTGIDTAMGRVNYLINCIERRLTGLRPIRVGSKVSVEMWVPA